MQSNSNSIPKEQLLADEIEWQLNGSVMSEWQVYWIFDPYGLLIEYKKSLYKTDADLYKGVCETFWLEDGRDIVVDENVFFFKTQTDAENFRRNWYEAA